jgi:hypothetical protein
MNFCFKNPTMSHCVRMLIPILCRLRFFIPILAIAVIMFFPYAEGNTVYLGWSPADLTSELSFTNKKNHISNSKFNLTVKTLRKTASKGKNNFHSKTSFLIRSNVGLLSRLFENREILTSSDEFYYSLDYIRPISSRSPPLIFLI